VRQLWEGCKLEAGQAYQRSPEESPEGKEEGILGFAVFLSSVRWA